MSTQGETCIEQKRVHSVKRLRKTTSPDRIRSYVSRSIAVVIIKHTYNSKLTLFANNFIEHQKCQSNTGSPAGCVRHMKLFKVFVSKTIYHPSA